MTYYLAQHKANHLPFNCSLCKLEIDLDHDTAQIVHRIFVDDDESIDEDKILSSLTEKYPNIQKIVQRNPTIRPDIDTKYAACDVASISKYVSKLTISLLDDDDTYDRSALTMSEIRPNTIFHKDSYNEGIIHISNDFEVVNTWSLNTEFVKYLLENGLTIQEHGNRLMSLAIKIHDLEMIDYLIDVGVDINYETKTGRYTLEYGEKGFYAASDRAELYYSHNFVELAAEESEFKVLKHILNRGCRHITSAIESCIEQETLSEIMPYFKIDEMTFAQKCEVMSTLIFAGDLKALKMFEKAGFIITNEIADSINSDDDGQSLSTDYIEKQILKHLISRGISAKYYCGTYEQSVCDGEMSIMQLIEKAGIFEHYRPARFLLSTVQTSSQIMRHILDLGIDPEHDKTEIRDTFKESLRNYESMKMLEPYVKNLDSELASETLDIYAERVMSGRKNPKNPKNLEKGIDLLVGYGAKPTAYTLCVAAESNLQFLELILSRFPEIDVDMNVATEFMKFREIPSEMNAKCSLIEAVIMFSPRDFESVLNLMLQKQPDLNSDRLILLFQIMAKIYTGVRYGQRFQQNLLSKAQFLADNQYLSQSFVESLGIQRMPNVEDIRNNNSDYDDDDELIY